MHTAVLLAACMPGLTMDNSTPGCRSHAQLMMGRREIHIPFHLYGLQGNGQAHQAYYSLRSACWFAVQANYTIFIINYYPCVTYYLEGSVNPSLFETKVVYAISSSTSFRMYPMGGLLCVLWIIQLNIITWIWKYGNILTYGVICKEFYPETL